ncbi:MAG: hypothetical protein RA161_02115 [Arsenophonus sp.]|nr:MAG: hypothetical protein RA161_02115 [Arsenophonus sp.]
MNMQIIFDNYYYLFFGNFPHGVLKGASLTLIISILSGLFSFFFRYY